MHKPQDELHIPERLQKFAEEPIQVLSDGEVQLVAVLGNENMIVNAARISFGKKAKDFKPESNRHLLRYLYRQRHSTPFEMCELILRIRMPMDAHRQQIRHRTASVNEYSTRYRPAIDSMDQTDPAAWRTQSKDNKQGSAGVLTEWPEDTPKGTEGGWVPPTADGTCYFASPGEYLSHREWELQKLSREVYEERLKFGVAREQARKDLPLSTYTEYIWKMDLHNLLHYLGLRLDSHAQQEIRSYAEAIAEIVKVWVPWVWEAFEDYSLGAMYLTRFEVEGIKAILQGYSDIAGEHGVRFPEKTVCEEALYASGLPQPEEGKRVPREWAEFEAKLERLLR